MNRSWFSIQNKAGTPAAELYLFDSIGSFGVTSQMFVAALNEIPKGRTIELIVDSRGGDVDAGLAIYDAIKRRGNVTARVAGMAASIASVIICAADRVEMPKHALVMIHDPFAPVAEGRAEDLRNKAEWLVTITNTIVDIYKAKTGKSEDEIRAAMKKSPGTLLSATECVEWGFCDELLDDARTKALINNFCQANHAGEAEGTPPPKPNQTMKNLLDALVEAKLISSASLTDEAAAAEIKASWGKVKNQLELAEKAQDEAAETAIAAAITAKKIKEDAKAFWKNAFKIDAKGAQAQLDAIETPKPRGTAPVPPQTGAETSDAKAIRAEFAEIKDPVKRSEFFAKNRGVLMGSFSPRD